MHRTSAELELPFRIPIYSKWFSEYSQLHPNVKINYQSIGSGGGIRQVTEGTVDFGASDGPMTDEQIAAAKVKVMHIPTVLGAVVPVYNIPGVSKELNFSGDVIADIYLGKISNWNDRPHREGQSRRQSAGPSDPAGISLGWKRNDVYLHGLSVQGDASLELRARKRHSGQVARRDRPEGQRRHRRHGSPVSEFFRLCRTDLRRAEQDDVRYGEERCRQVRARRAPMASPLPLPPRRRLCRRTTGSRSRMLRVPTAYPISSFTWLLIPTHSTDPAKTKALVEFLGWMLDHGEAEAAALTYAPLPKPVQDMVRKSIASIK